MFFVLTKKNKKMLCQYKNIILNHLMLEACKPFPCEPQKFRIVRDSLSLSLSFSLFSSIFYPVRTCHFKHNDSKTKQNKQNVKESTVHLFQYTCNKELRTHKSGLASILLKKSPPMGCKELINLFRTTSVSTLKYCVYDEMLKTPFQLLADCCGPSPSA